MNYTAGPWIREHGVFVIAKCKPFKTDESGTTIRKLTICRTDNPHMPESEQGANASLMAAAPELLETCKDLAHQLATLNQKFLNKNDKYSALQTGVVQSYNKAMKAIAKAEGGVR